MKDLRYKHGLRYTPEYRIWRGIKTRILDANSWAYSHYGGRGLTLFKEWDEFMPFYRYLQQTIGLRPSQSMTLDRIDNDKGYMPGNLRWATRKEQTYNRRSNHHIKYKGKTQTITEWAEELGMNRVTLFSRINTYNWPTEKAFTAKLYTRPKRGYCKRGHFLSDTYSDTKICKGCIKRGLTGKV